MNILNVLRLTYFDVMECTGPGSLANVKKETHFPQQTYLLLLIYNSSFL